ncbi:hypothetical protein QFC22_002956 [Naganishia vaughanmartiniae]|uniref:Uncharacterized protein n=1 Tax=Naganishia vaughanmartiniae TaxID=1424756 RepID=A0ACC2X9L7_9TREE|nr:hypothetical protein QFC22_002956 [Naganishia vaughanmartiniae]
MSSESPLPPTHNVLHSSEGHPLPQLPKTNQGIRVCQVIQLKPEALEDYKKCHQAVFPGVLRALRRSGVVVTNLTYAVKPDYSIHHFELPLVPSALTSAPLTEPAPATTHLLVAHMRYIKSDSLDDFKADMAKIGHDEETQRWWQMSVEMLGGPRR